MQKHTMNSGKILPRPLLFKTEGKLNEETKYAVTVRDVGTALVNARNPGEAKKYFGANAKNNVDYEIIAPAKGGSIRSTNLGRFEDIDAIIKPVDEI